MPYGKAKMTPTKSKATYGGSKGYSHHNQKSHKMVKPKKRKAMKMDYD